MEQYDVAVIGGGPGGYTAAIRAAQLGAKVCLIEKHRIGGTCLNYGCIPTKALLSSVAALSLVRRAEEFGVQAKDVAADYSFMLKRKAEIVQKLSSGIEFLLKSWKIDLVRGRGRLLSPQEVRIEEPNGGNEQIHANHLILAPGSRPAYIPVFGIDGVQVITSNEALSLPTLPERLIIVGGGVIGCEFACLFSELGVEITILELMPRLIPTEDRQIAQRLAASLKRRGIKIKTKVRITRIEKTSSSVKAILDTGEEIEADKALVSIGRALNTQDLGLEEAGVSLGSRGEIIVSDKMETSASGVYAIGDAVGKVMLAHVAARQGMIAAANTAGKTETMDYRAVPSAIFTHPEIGSVGLTEAKAKEAGHKVTVGTFSFMALGKALAQGEAEGSIRVVADAQTDKLLGVQIIGPHATDLIAEAALAIQLGATAEDITRTIHAHPTLAEGFLEAAEDVHKQAIHVAKRR